MSTIVCFHAHPDDEVIATGGLISAAVADGHRVVLVVATRGERGEIAPDTLAEGEQLAMVRSREVRDAAEMLGISRVEFMGYFDSGMMGEDGNDDPDCFWQADVASAARRFGAILDEENPSLVTVYDDKGSYGHPDHIQVHRVGVAAARSRGIRVLEATINRDRMRAQMEQMAAAMSPEVVEEMDMPDLDGDDSEFGVPEARITHEIDVSAHLAAKREALAIHRTQVPADSFFFTMPPEAFAAAFGLEAFIEHGKTREPGAAMIDSIWASA